MWKNPVLLLLIFYFTGLVGCDLSRQFNFEIQVSDTRGKPLQNVSISVQDKPFGQTDELGLIAFKHILTFPEKVRIEARDASVEKLHLMGSLELATPPFWSRGVQKIHFELAEVEADSAPPAIEETAELRKLLRQDYDRSETSEAKTPGPIESEVVDDSTSTSKDFQAVENNVSRSTDNQWLKILFAPPSSLFSLLRTPDLNSANAVLSEEKSVPLNPIPVNPETVANLKSEHPEPLLKTNEKKPSSEENLHVQRTLHVSLQGKPLVDAQVFMGRSRSKTLEFLGGTGGDGNVSITWPRDIWGESIFIRHACCIPTLRPLLSSQLGTHQNVELNAGVGLDFFIQNYAYGLGRGIEKTTLGSTQGAADVTSSLGLAVAQLKTIGSGLFISGPELVPPRKEIGDVPRERNPTMPKITFVGVSKPFLPYIGLVESVMGKAEQNGSAEFFVDGKLRRLRRDFFTRFIQTKSFRPIIASEVKRITKSLGLFPLEMLSSGWEFTPVSAEFDHLLYLEYQNDSVRQSLKTKFVDRTGKILWEKNVKNVTQSNEPENLGQQLYSEFMRTLPFEGTVLAVVDKKATLNWNTFTGIDLKPGDTVDLYGPSPAEPDGAPTYFLGNAEVENVTEEYTRVALNSETLARPGTRVVRHIKELDLAERNKNH